MVRGDEVMVQSSLRLPKELFDRLTAIGKQNGGGMGEEIRRRLEASFKQDAAIYDAKVGVDRPTQQLIDAVAFFADDTNSSYGAWSENPFAFDVMKECLVKAVDQYKPKGASKPLPKEDSIMDVIFGQEKQSVADVSRVFLATWLNRLKAWPSKGA